MTRPLIDLTNVSAHTPIRLSTAAMMAFPDGTMTASGLRREGARGRLIVERIAGKDYTTLEYIERMRTLCRVEAKGRDFGGVRTGSEVERLSREERGLLSMVASISPQDALLAKVGRRKSS